MLRRDIPQQISHPQESKKLASNRRVLFFGALESRGQLLVKGSCDGVPGAQAARTRGGNRQPDCDACTRLHCLDSCRSRSESLMIHPIRATELAVCLPRETFQKEESCVRAFARLQSRFCVAAQPRCCAFGDSLSHLPQVCPYMGLYREQTCVACHTCTPHAR